MLLMLLLQVMIITIFKLIYRYSEFQDILDDTLANDDGRHSQAL